MLAYQELCPTGNHHILNQIMVSDAVSQRCPNTQGTYSLWASLTDACWRDGLHQHVFWTLFHNWMLHHIGEPYSCRDNNPLEKEEMVPQVKVMKGMKGICLLEKMLLLFQKEHSPPSADELVTSVVQLEPQSISPFQEKAAKHQRWSWHWTPLFA